uniref:Uncharacterized protein n=1 Tax=Amphimedon queenslandica TaxID=400682 RepID=A0A1X7VYI9_AMPQE
MLLLWEYKSYILCMETANCWDIYFHNDFAFNSVVFATHKGVLIHMEQHYDSFMFFIQFQALCHCIVLMGTINLI